MSYRCLCAALLVCLLFACDRAIEAPAPPALPLVTTSYCATDMSCPPGQECINGVCAPIRPALRSHIQTASALLREPFDLVENAWRGAHYDLHISGVWPDAIRAINPNARFFEYTLVRFPNPDSGPTKNHWVWGVANGYDPENFFLHYRVDTYVPTWEGRVLVPGYPAGMVPGWNPGGPEGPATALLRSQSRVPRYYIGSSQPQYFVNIEDPGYKQFLVERSAELIEGTWWYGVPYATGPLDGIMCDEAIYYALFNEGLLARSDEYYGLTVNDNHPYPVAFEEFYGYLAESLLERLNRTADVMPNYGHVLFLNYPNRSAHNIQSITPWAWGEVWVTYTGLPAPTSGGNRCISYEKDYVNGVTSIITQTRVGGRRILGARDTANGTAGTDRGKILTLGLYYLVHHKNTYYMYESAGHSHPTHMQNWAYNPAVDYNIGNPIYNPAGVPDYAGKTGTLEHFTFATGPDPYNPSLTYRVLGRQFSRALVLVKLLPEGSVDDSRSNTVHALGRTYRPLLANGTLGAPVTQAVIRNNEALILIPETLSGVR